MDDVTRRLWLTRATDRGYDPANLLVPGPCFRSLPIFRAELPGKQNFDHFI
jgi:hypothetical protein